VRPSRSCPAPEENLSGAKELVIDQPNLLQAPMLQIRQHLRHNLVLQESVDRDV
jgi:hypothetical protein